MNFQTNASKKKKTGGAKVFLDGKGIRAGGPNGKVLGTSTGKTSSAPEKKAVSIPPKAVAKKYNAEGKTKRQSSKEFDMVMGPLTKVGSGLSKKDAMTQAKQLRAEGKTSYIAADPNGKRGKQYAVGVTKPTMTNSPKNIPEKKIVSKGSSASDFIPKKGLLSGYKSKVASAKKVKSLFK